MNHEPTDPVNTPDASEPPVAAGGARDTGSSAFFDRAGCAWIAACLALAGWSGYWLPRVAEPGGFGNVMVAMGLVGPASPGLSGMVRHPVREEKEAAAAAASADHGKPASATANLALRMF